MSDTFVIQLNTEFKQKKRHERTNALLKLKSNLRKYNGKHEKKGGRIGSEDCHTKKASVRHVQENGRSSGKSQIKQPLTWCCRRSLF